MVLSDDLKAAAARERPLHRTVLVVSRVDGRQLDHVLGRGRIVPELNPVLFARILDLNVDIYYEEAFLGAIILLAVSIESIRTKIAERLM